MHAFRYPTIALTCALALGTPSLARERVSRVYDERDGLVVAETSELAQDARGFVWVGTVGGLFRFDGEEMRPWAPGEVRHVVQILEAGANGEVIVAGRGEPLWQVRGEGVEPVLGPARRPFTSWVHATVADDGALWVASPDTLWRRDTHDSWTSWAGASFGARLYRVLPDRADSVLVGTTEGLWQLGPGGEPRIVAAVPYVWLAKRLSNGMLVVLTRTGRLLRLTEAGPLVLEDEPGGIGLAVRGTTAWATIGKYTKVFPLDGPPAVIAPAVGLGGGRPLLVDREGSLWIGGYRGLIELSEPLTVAFDESDGLPSPPHAHHLARTRDAVWVVAWHGSVRVDLAGNDRHVVAIGPHSGRMREDPLGRLWGVELDRGFECWQGERVARYPREGVHGLYGTSPRGNGTMWLATDDGLFLTVPERGAPRLVRTAPPRLAGWKESWVGPVLEDRAGRLWLAQGETIWNADADSLARDEAASWRAEELTGCGGMNEILEVSPGILWVGTMNAGVWQRDERPWRPLPGNEQLSSLRVYGMTPSRTEGTWILTAGTIARAEARPDDPAGWTILERLDAWQGLPTQQAGDLHEDPDGRLWMATLAGLVEMPPAARFAPIPPPPLELVDVRVDGVRRPLGARVQVPRRPNQLEICFAALSYRDRSRLRYQIRERPDAPWRSSSEPAIRLVNLPPGAYEAQVRATLDGTHWTESPAGVRFDVARPWWQEAWALAAFAALAAALALSLHRLRVSVLLRLERQRVRIARDLHDEMGSGLGSIGILAGLAADDELDVERRREIASRIGETATELGGALGDLVRSLQAGADTLEDFARRLASRAGRLVPGETPCLRLAFPESWPDVRLAPEVQRELQAIVVEALHNAARHADARTIELGFAPRARHWRVWVHDDGHGLGTAERRAGGHGLANMRARAAVIGAVIAISGTPGSGTMVEVRFAPATSRRTIMRAHDGPAPEMLEPDEHA